LVLLNSAPLCCCSHLLCDGGQKPTCNCPSFGILAEQTCFHCSSCAKKSPGADSAFRVVRHVECHLLISHFFFRAKAAAGARAGPIR
jgi:hypothetical protein